MSQWQRVARYAQELQNLEEAEAWLADMQAAPTVVVNWSDGSALPGYGVIRKMIAARVSASFVEFVEQGLVEQRLKVEAARIEAVEGYEARITHSGAIIRGAKL